MFVAKQLEEVLFETDLLKSLLCLVASLFQQTYDIVPTVSQQTDINIQFPSKNFPNNDFLPVLFDSR